MGSRKRRGRQNVVEGEDEEIEEEESKNDEFSEYEKLRDQRIRENVQRMQKLGILELSRTLKSDTAPPKRLKRNPPERKYPLTPSDPPRRSSRLQNLNRVSYLEMRTPKEKPMEEKPVEIYIQEGSAPEIYTEEHEKLLGDCKTVWTLNVDGYGNDGERIYDPYGGKSCHQCRQKTLGHRTNCSKCKSVQGQFCGDCLYTRYGENVLEAKEDLGWICPVCRGICNCSRCRRVKGWAPTGPLYTKVLRLGFKSVAHYLIQTRQYKTKWEELAADMADMSSSADTEAKSPLNNESLDSDINPDGILEPQSKDNNVKMDGNNDDDDDYNEEDDKNDDD